MYKNKYTISIFCRGKTLVNIRNFNNMEKINIPNTIYLVSFILLKNQVKYVGQKKKI